MTYAIQSPAVCSLDETQWNPGPAVDRRTAGYMCEAPHGQAA